MGIAQRTLLEQAARSKGRGTGVARPALEVALAAAMALGVGQAGWHALSAPAASASGPEDATTTETAAATAAFSLEASPFAPQGGAVDPLALGQLDLLRVTGLRMAADPTRSGAILAIGDGRQQAYLVGQDVLSGVRLVAVRGDSIVVAYAGGERTIAMPVSQATGLQAALATAAGPSPALAAPTTPAAFGPAEQAWLAATLRDPVLGDAGLAGYRLAPNAPAAVIAAGVQSGDVIEAINGAPAADPLAAIAALQAGDAVALTVRRQDGATSLVRFTLPAAAGTMGSAP